MIDRERVLVLGKGFLGKEYEKHGYTVWGRDKFEFTKTYKSYSFHEKTTEVSNRLYNNINKFDVIINCIGSADTRKCEEPDNWDQTYSLNSELPTILSQYCKNMDKKFIHISTGCVYDNNNTPQKEDGFLSSHCRYVVSKLCAEYGCDPQRDLILRPRLYFSGTDDKNNLLTKLPTFTRHLNEINSYTSLRTIVEATTALLINNQSGIFNVANTGYSTLEQIVSILGLEQKPTIGGEDLQSTQGIALVNNILDTSKLEEFYIPRPLCEEIINCYDELYN